MKQPRQLRIVVLPEDAPEFFHALDGGLSHGWTRAFDIEERSAPSLQPLIVCFRCDARKERPAAVLSLAKSSDASFTIGRVTTDGDFDEMALEERNRVVTDFCERCLARIRGQATALVGVWSDNVEIEDLISAEAFLLLKAADAEERKFLPDSKPWFDLLVKLSSEDQRLTPDLLSLWLQSQSWSDCVARKRAEHFEFGLNLLAYLRNAPHGAQS